VNISDLRFGKDNSKHAKYVLNFLHGKRRKGKVSGMLKVILKGRCIDTWERYYMQTCI
jgi:hypothetical protein